MFYGSFQCFVCTPGNCLNIVLRAGYLSVHTTGETLTEGAPYKWTYLLILTSLLLVMFICFMTGWAVAITLHIGTERFQTTPDWARSPKPILYMLVCTLCILKSPELVLRCWKSPEIIECGHEGANHWWSNFLWFNLVEVEKLGIVVASFLGHRQLNTHSFFAVVYKL